MAAAWIASGTCSGSKLVPREATPPPDSGRAESCIGQPDIYAGTTTQLSSPGESSLIACTAQASAVTVVRNLHDVAGWHRPAWGERRDTCETSPADRRITAASSG